MAMYLSLSNLELAQRVESEGRWFTIPVSVLEETAASVRSQIDGGSLAGWMGGVSTENHGLEVGLPDAGVERLWDEIGDPEKWPVTRVERQAAEVGDTVMLIGVGVESNAYRLLRIHAE